MPAAGPDRARVSAQKHAGPVLPSSELPGALEPLRQADASINGHQGPAEVQTAAQYGLISRATLEAGGVRQERPAGLVLAAALPRVKPA